MQQRFDGRMDEIAMARIREFAPTDGQPYWLAFSGGKDSCVLMDLTKRSGVIFEAVYNVTGIDPPEVLAFMREHHPDVRWIRPDRPFFVRLLERGFPTRKARWCCEFYKEGRRQDGQIQDGGRTVLTGVRAAESIRRRNRGMVSQYHRGTIRKTMVNPIIDWSESDVWTYIREHKLPYCSLYDEGWSRLGCILCPQNRESWREAERWPRFAAAWRRAFVALWQKHAGLQERWSSPDVLFETWMDRDAPLHGDLTTDAECELFTGAGCERKPS